MSEQEIKKYQDFLNRMVSSKLESIEGVDRLIGINIDHVRSFTATLLTLNITVIGAVVATYITNSKSISYGSLVILGMTILVVNTVSVLFYSAFVLIGENTRLTSRKKFLKSSFDNVIELAHTEGEKQTLFDDFEAKVYFPKLKDFAEKEKTDMNKIEKESLSMKYLYLFCALFIFGLILILLGIYQWIKYLIF